MFINRKPGLRPECVPVLGLLCSTGARTLPGSKRYRGSYTFADESLVPGGASPILSVAFDGPKVLQRVVCNGGPCDSPRLQIRRADVKSWRRSPEMNAPMPPITPLMKPPRWPLNRRNRHNRRSRMPRKEAQVPGRVSGPPNQRSAIARRRYGNCSM